MYSPPHKVVDRPLEIIHVGNATDAHARDFAANDALLLVVLKAFRTVHMLTTRYYHCVTFSVCV